MGMVKICDFMFTILSPTFFSKRNHKPKYSRLFIAPSPLK